MGSLFCLFIFVFRKHDLVYFILKLLILKQKSALNLFENNIHVHQLSDSFDKRMQFSIKPFSIFDL